MSRAGAFVWLPRVGYVTRGLVYLLLAWPIVEAAISKRRFPSVRGVLSALSDWPLGAFCVAAVGLGFLALTAWGLFQAVLDFSGRGSSLKGLLARGGMLVKAFLHLILAGTAGAVLADQFGLMDEDLKQGIAVGFATVVLHWPLGEWLVGLVGAGTIALGIGQVVRARRAAFKDIQAGHRTMAVVRILGRLGLSARGVIFGVIGALFLHAAWHARAAEAGGLRAALRIVADAPLGSWPLLGIAAGLATYGAFSLAKGWYHAPLARTRPR